LENDLNFFDIFENLFIYVFRILNYFKIGVTRCEWPDKHLK